MNVAIVSRLRMGIGNLRERLAVQIQDRHQVHEAPRHGQIGDVRTPYLIGTLYGDIPQ